MLESGIANITLFFVIVGISLFFIVIWIMKSESKLKLSKSEIQKLKSRIESTLKEKFMLEEKIDSIESTSGGTAPGREGSGPQSPDAAISEELLQEMYRKNQALGSENKKLKKELDEAKDSLEEIYKALSAKG